MKLTFILLLITLLRVNASTYAQNVSINVKNATIKEVFSELTKQTGYNFICDVELIKDIKPITITANKISLKEFLDRCFENQSVNILFNTDNTVVITERNNSRLPLASSNNIISITVTGVVTDDTGEPLPGVSVTEKSTNNGVVTDNSGKYTLKVADPNSVIVFSFIGLETKEIKVEKQTVINVQLNVRTGGLDEVVVLGYTTQKKASVTGSVSTITGTEIVTTKSQSVLNMLTGKLPGVRIVQNTSEPGNFNNNFDIRGFGSPLVVIDGVPRGGTIDRLDPNDIENISVLKDAAAAVYGVQAGNGVVLVTTKKGKAGTSEITFSSMQGIQHESGVQTALNAVDYMNLVNEKTMHNIGAPSSIIYTPAQIADFGPGGTKKSTDWFDETFRRTALQNQQNVSVTGGTDKSSYFMSMGYLNQGSFYKTNAENYHKYNMRSNVSANITKGLTADLKLSYISDTRDYPTKDAQELLNSVYRNPPIYAAYAGDPGNHLNNFGDHGVNAVAYSDKDIIGYRRNNKKILQGSFDLIYNIPFVPGLTAKALYSYNNTLDDNKTFNKEFDLYQPFIQGDGSTAYTILANNNPSNVTQSYATAPSTLMQFSLAYNHTFNKYHNIQASAIYEEGTSSNFGFSGTKYIAISTLDQLAAGGDVTIGSTTSFQNVGGGFPGKSATRSLLGILHYDYKGKYLIDLTGRRDGSSNFSPTRQFGFFPGGSVGWRISEEDFIKNNSALAFIDNLKLRASYGQTGQAGQVNFQFLTAYNYPEGNANVQGRPPGYVFNGTFVKDIGFRAIPNENATWASVTNLNLGLDAEFWHGLFGFTVEVFQRKQTGLLANPSTVYPAILGADLSQVNVNSNQTNGVDIDFSHRNTIGKLGYSVSGNLSFTRTKNLYQVRGASGNSYSDWLSNNNNRYNDLYRGYGDNGRFTSFNDIYNADINYGGGNRSTIPGDYKYLDWNGDGTINLNGTAGQSDQYIIGTNGTTPLVGFGLTVALQYAHFDVNALFQGAAGKWISYTDASLTPLQFNDNAFNFFLDRWHPVDPTANQFDPHTVYTPGYYSISGTNPDANSLYNVQNASYVRLKTLELGYSFPSKWARVVGVKRARIYANGYNLFTITGVRHYDPEHPNSDRSNDYPLNKTYNLGLSVTF